MQTLRLFVSSPSDVLAERQLAGKVIERLQGKYWSFVRLEDVFWERNVARATAHFQDELRHPGSCDIVVGILWSRLGSPLPERFRNRLGIGHATGTEWELDEAFNAYEASVAECGDPSLAKPDVIVYRRLGERAPSEGEDPAEIRRQEEALESYLRREFRHDDEHGTIKRSLLLYEDAAEFERRLEADLETLILRRLPALKPGFEPPPISGCPFKGLEAFGYKDADRFFGRTRQVRDAQDRLRGRASAGSAFVLIYGASGSGKSSLMRAGLAPVLTRPGGALPGMERWRRALMQPASGTGGLCERLARALLSPAPGGGDGADGGGGRAELGFAEFAGTSMGDPEAENSTWDLASFARYLAYPDEERVYAVGDFADALAGAGLHLLLQIDQLEEVFAEGVGEEERDAFLQAIRALSGCGRIWCVATMRSEYFPRVAEEPALRELVGRDGGYILPPPDWQSWGEIIRHPALAARLGWERRIGEVEIAGERCGKEWLDEQILEEVKDSSDALPLLEVCLERLYEDTLDPEDERGLRRASDLLTWKSYAAMGGLRGAVATRAEEAFAGLQPSARGARDYLFGNLVRVEETVTRRRADLEELRSKPGAGAFIEAFLEAKLFVTDEEGGRAVLTLAHESLLSHWPVLAEWIEEHRGDLAAHQRLIRQAELWKESGRSKKYLLSEGHLAEAGRVADRELFLLGEDEAELLRRSRAEARKRLRRLRAAAVGFALFAAAAGGLWWVAEERKAEALRTLSRSDFAYGSEAVERDSTAEGVAYLARALRNDPSNRAAAQRLFSVLTARTHLLPVSPAVRLESDLVEWDLSPDGTRLMVRTVAGGARLLDTAGGKQVGGSFYGRDELLQAVRFLDDDELVVLSASLPSINAAGDPESFLVLRRRDAATWEASGDPIQTGVSLRSPVVTVEPNSRLVALRDRQGSQLSVWSLDEGRAACPPLLVGGEITLVAISPTGEFAVVVEDKRALRVFRLDTGEQAGEPAEAAEGFEYEDFKFLANGGAFALVAGQDSEGGRRWVLLDALSGEGRGWWEDPNFRLREATLDSEAIMMAATGTDGHLHLVSLRGAGRRLAEPTPHRGFLAALLHPGARRAVTLPEDRAIQLREWAPSIPGGRVLLATRGASMGALSPDADFLAVAHAGDRRVAVHRVADGRPAQEGWKHAEPVSWVGFCPNGVSAASTDMRGAVRIQPLSEDGPEVWAFDSGGTLPVLDFDAEGRWLLVSTNGNLVTLWDRLSRERAFECPGFGQLRSFGFLEGAREFFIVRGGEVEIWNVERAEKSGGFRPVPNSSSLAAAAASADRRLLATASGGEGIAVWELSAPERKVVSIVASETPQRLGFTRDAGFLYAMFRNEVKIYDLAASREAAPPLLLRGLKSVEFSPDGGLLLTTHADGARLWDWRSGRPVTDSLRTVFPASFSRDGRQVLLGENFICRLIQVPPTGEAPGWLASAAESVMQRRLNAEGILEAVPAEAWLEAESALAELQQPGFWSEFGRWLAADRWERPVVAGDGMGSTFEFLEKQAEEVLRMMDEGE